MRFLLHLRRRWRVASCLATLLVAGASCSDAPNAPATRSISKATNSGDLQGDTVLATLAPLRVLVLAGDKAARGATVYWTTSEDDAEQATTADGSGIASLALTLGSKAGAVTVVASLALGGSGPSVTFTVNGRPGQPTGIRMVSGTNQSDSVTARLGANYIVQATDSHGNGVAGVVVNWAVRSGDGSIDPPRSTTAQPDGLATTRHTLGPSTGEQTVSATAASPGAPVIFRATATPGQPVLIKLVSGNNQAGDPGQPLNADYVVRAIDFHGNGVAGVAIDWAITAGGGNLSTVTTLTGADGYASIRSTLGAGGVLQTVTATANGLRTTPGVTFTSSAGFGIKVTARTTGVDPDPNGFSVSANGSGLAEVRIDVPTNGSATMGLGPGTYTVTMTGLAANCEVAGSSSRSVTVSGPGSVEVAFDIVCSTAMELALELTVGGKNDIYRMKANGAGLTRLTTQGLNYAPAWSPDGSRIAFLSNRSGSTDLYVMSADGSGQLRLTTFSGTFGVPSWSPDGTRIAIAIAIGSILQIYVANTDGSGLVRLTAPAISASQPSWSPDGARIAFIGPRVGNFTGALTVINADGTGAVQLTSPSIVASDPAWSPDGTKIAFTLASVSPPDVYVVNRDGSGSTRLAQSASQPRWSPDGTTLLLTHNYTCYYYYYYCNTQLMTINANGSGPATVTSGAYDSGGAWSPDGRWIAFTSFPDGVARLVRPDGSRLADLAVGSTGNLSWKR